MLPESVLLHIYSFASRTALDIHCDHAIHRPIYNTTLPYTCNKTRALTDPNRVDNETWSTVDICYRQRVTHQC
jgi:hypothetical protein